MAGSQRGANSGYHLVTCRDSRLAIFVQGSDGRLWMRRQIQPNGIWDNWDDLNKPPGGGEAFRSLAVGGNQDGHLEAFVIKSGELWHAWETN